MRVAFVIDHHVDGAGYVSNNLPRQMAELGHEVAIFTSSLYPNYPNYDLSYGPTLGPRKRPIGSTVQDGVTVVRLPSRETPIGVHLEGLRKRLASFAPSVIQNLSVTASVSTMQVVEAGRALHVPVFLQDHTSASIFNPSLKGRAFLSGFRTVAAPRVNSRVEKCFIPSPEIRDIVCAYYGLDSGLVVLDSLGVNTDLFYPSSSASHFEERTLIRGDLGVQPDETMFIYTGRFHVSKGPEIAARAISLLRSEGLRAVGLFVGSSTPQERGAIQQHDGCMVHAAVSPPKLARFYRASDVAVWPLQESLSILDAMACGLPTIVGSHVQAPERRIREDLIYKSGDAESMADAMRPLLEAEHRKEIGSFVAQFARDHLDWRQKAQSRLAAFGMTG